MSSLAITNNIINKNLKAKEQSTSSSSSSACSSSPSSSYLCAAAATKGSLINKLKIEGSKADINDWIDFWYYIVGVNVLPAASQQKKPAVGWLQWQDKPIPESQLNIWKKQNMFQGIIIIPGKVWRGDNQGKYLIHIDCDKKEAIDAFCIRNGMTTSLEKLSEKFIIEQHKDNLNRAHLMFYSPIPFPQKTNDGMTGIEVKGDIKHGVACCAPSIHEDGYRYEILGTLEPITLSDVQAQQLMQHLQNICRIKGTKYIDRESNLTEGIKQSLQNLKINKAISISQGSRHNTMLPIADSLLTRHIIKKDVAKLKDFFDKINNENCKPSLKDAELTNIWNNAIKFVENSNTISKSNFSSSNQLSRIESEEDGDKNGSGIKGRKEGTDDDDDEDALIEQATEKILSSYHFITIEESKEILIYQNGVYVEGGDIIIDKLSEEILGFQLKNYILSEIKGHIIRRTFKSRKEIDKDINIINLENGLYDIKNDELKPHSPDYLSINQKPIFFDKNTKPKLFGKFLSQVLYSSEIRTAIEAVAYTFWRDCPFEHYFKLHGHGANGKSVFTGLLTKLHGEKNVSNVSLLSLTNNHFAISDLKSKDVNIDTELSTSDAIIKDSSMIKKLTGGRKQPIRIEQKYQKAYDIYIHAKLFFNANTIIQLPNPTAADYRREIIISFPNTFEGKKDDPNLLDKLSSNDEVSGIFNVLMRALRRILKNKKLFFNEKTIDERRLKHERSLNPVKAFIEEAILTKEEDNDIAEEDYIIKEDLYNSFEKYCIKYKIAPKSMIVVGRDLKKLGWKEGRESKGENRKTCWVGVRLKPEYMVMERQQQLVT